VAVVVLRSLAKKVGRGAKSSVKKKRVFDSEGRPVKVLSIDSNSSSFSSDLELIFKKNVARARRENKKRFGSPDRVLKKA
jgi:hypothetical protein